MAGPVLAKVRRQRDFTDVNTEDARERYFVQPTRWSSERKMYTDFGQTVHRTGAVATDLGLQSFTSKQYNSLQAVLMALCSSGR